MKRLFNLFATAALACFCLSCSGSDDNTGDSGVETPVITVAPSELAVKAAAGDYTLQVTASRGEWTSFSNDDWVTVSNAHTNEAHGVITVSVAENKGSTGRQATITVKSGTARATVVVGQGAALTLSKTKINSASIGGKEEITVSSSENWEVKSETSWITVEKTSDKTFSLNIESNDSEQSRDGMVKVKTPSQTVELPIRQESVLDRTMKIPEGYTLVWHDEFDGDKLGPDWTEEVKPSGWVNNERQNYIKGSSVNDVSNGKLNIHCYKGNDGKVYSGRVYACVNKGWQYGYFEARIKLPKGKGTWPAFWMMPVGNDWNTNPWPKCGEIDIMEEVGVVPNEVSSSIHTQKYNHTIGTQKTHKMTLADAEGEFHVYALEWTEDAITTYVDGEVQLSVKKSVLGTDHDAWPFHYPFYPILNLAWGGDWGGMNGVDESVLPITMEVDYVRIFQK
ncbi:MAG: family 16 glycosylhydrolase [Prevotella sp.]|jgi:beta-glucanase (GH16 family)